MKSKWLSRKLLAAIAAVVVIAITNWKGEAAGAEAATHTAVLSEQIPTIATALVGMIYIFAQGRVDEKNPEDH